jgi:hypothetical protein
MSRRGTKIGRPATPSPDPTSAVKSFNSTPLIAVHLLQASFTFRLGCDRLQCRPSLGQLSFRPHYWLFAFVDIMHAASWRQRLPLDAGRNASPPTYAYLIFHNPLDHFTLFDLQGLSQRRRADQVVLAVLFASLNHLDGGLIAHAWPPARLDRPAKLS